jgi:hypothetical protein
VNPGASGNPDLRAEKGKELEMGFDLGLVGDRIGFELTYFHKITDDQILSLPVAPSTGVTGTNQPQVNIGSMLNKGFEIASNARILSKENFAWEVRGAVNTLHNEVLDLGETAPTQTRKEGYPISGEWDYRIKEVDLVNNRVIVSDTLEFLGNDPNLPGWETTLSTTFTVFKDLSFYLQADGRGDRYVFDSTEEFRDRQLPRSESAIRGAAAFGTNPDGTPTDEARIKYMRRYGPWVTESGRTLVRGDVLGDYYQDGTFFRLREASVSYRVPRSFVERFVRAKTAQVTVAMRNLKTWTDFGGLDPETGQFLTVPLDKRYTVRFNVTY